MNATEHPDDRAARRQFELQQLGENLVRIASGEAAEPNPDSFDILSGLSIDDIGVVMKSAAAVPSKKLSPVVRKLTSLELLFNSALAERDLDMAENVATVLKDTMRDPTGWLAGRVLRHRLNKAKNS